MKSLFMKINNQYISFSDLEKAWSWIIKNFPFPGYIPPGRKSSYFEMPLSISKYLSKDAQILDFGAGPCDKTAMLSLIGYKVTAFDDFGDDWHNFDNNKSKIINFAELSGIQYITPNSSGDINFQENYYDAIILNNVVEHFHDSPRILLNRLIKSLKPNGYIFISVPNAVNLRKRIDVIRAKTNYAPFAYYYWTNPWRGHIREYVKNDLEKMGAFLNLKEIEISTHHYHLETLRISMRIIFRYICKIFPTFRESWLYVGQKPIGWQEKIKPNESEFKSAFGKQYFDYKKEDFER